MREVRIEPRVHSAVPIRREAKSRIDPSSPSAEYSWRTDYTPDRLPRNRAKIAPAWVGACPAWPAPCSSSGCRLLLRRRGLPGRRPTPLRRRDDPRPPLGAQAALLLAGLRGRWSRRRFSLDFPGSRPAFPLRNGHAPARSGAQHALRRGGPGWGRGSRMHANPVSEFAYPRLDVLKLLLVADERGAQEVRFNREWHKL